jgi:hypothetical protein
MIASPVTDAEILAEVIGPDRPDMPPDVARSFLKFQFSEVQKERMRELADLNNRGILSKQQRAQMESFLRVGHFLALIQAKARLSLNREAKPGS